MAPVLWSENNEKMPGDPAWKGCAAQVAAVLIILFVTTVGRCQYRPPVTSAGFTFAAGWYDGVADVLQHHYSDSVFPQTDRNTDKFWLGGDRKYWDPAISWKNKYWRDFPLSETTLVWMTDGWHLSKSLRNVSYTGAILTYRFDENRPWWHYALDIIIITAARSAGWHTADKLLRNG